MTESYKQLVDKLNSYIRKYNFYLLIKGLIFFIFLSISYLTIISVVEYFSYLSSSVRTFLFYFSFLILIGVAFFYLVIPFLRLIGLIKLMSFEKAAQIISNHFPEIEDRLLNVVELAKNEEESEQSLVWASIDEKIKKIKLVDFSKIITFKYLINSVLFLLSAVFISFILSFTLPGLYTESSVRLLLFEQRFVKPAPFSFKVLNDSLEIKKGDQLTLAVRCVGREVPEVLYVTIAGSNYMMTKKDDVFTYQLEHVNNSFSVSFTDLVYHSDNYLIDVLPAPVILDYSVEIIPPAYTTYEQTNEKSLGDVEVPFGSTIRWSFNTVDTDSLFFTIEDQLLFARKSDNKYEFDYIAKKDLNYSISVKNKNFDYHDLLNFTIEVIPDLYPEIRVVQLIDSTDFTRFYFKGTIGDDYGFYDLNYHLVINQNDSVIELPIMKNLRQQNFYFTYDFRELAGLADVVNYHFTVRDNDYFHNYKEAVSESFQFIFPSKEELEKLDDQNFQDLESMMKKSFELSQEIKQSVEELKYKSLSENSSNWEKQQLVSEILNKKNQLENILDQVQQKNKEMNHMKNSFSEEKTEMIEKQQQIEKLLEDVFNDELKELFDEFNKLAQEFDQSKFDELSDRSEMSMEDLSKQLERNLQMLKRMKVEQKVEEVIDGLSGLGENEKSNAVQLEENRNFEETDSLENENKKTLQSLTDDLKKALELNESLEKPMNIHSMDDEFGNINSNYDEIGALLKQHKKNKSVEQIEENATNYEKASFMLKQMLAMNKQAQNMANIHDLQQILDNLVFVSLRQEVLHDEIRVIDESDPRLSEVRREQNRLINQSKVVKDSLYALAKRTPAIGNVVTKELVNLEFSMEETVRELEENRLNTALKQQQNAITAANNMALFLNEALQNLQKQMANSMPGDQQGDKPGSNKGQNLNMLKESQQNLKQQLQQMIEQMKNGQSGNRSKQIGQSLAQQEMMQQMIRDLMMSSEVGSSAKEQLKQINQLLEMNNVDLANKNITTTMISRQNLILNKLLKAEKAEMERDVDDERESKTVDDDFYSNPIEFFEYKNQENEFKDVLEKNNYQLRIFYDRKYKDYINHLRKEN